MTLELELDYHLAELPSAQHRAGLAGLILMIRELDLRPELQNYENPIVEIVKNSQNRQILNEFSVKIRINYEGLKALFDLTYQSFIEQRWTESKIKNPQEVKEEERIDPKTNKSKTIKSYRYDVVVPSGAFLGAWDSSHEETNQGIWVKLWRDMLWNVIRGVPTTRIPFNSRVSGASYDKDVDKIWKELQKPEKAIGQTGQYYLGAMASTPDNIPVKDQIRYQFLLHFWPFVAQVYCPAILDKDGKRELSGYVLAIPDIANLKRFCHSFPEVVKARSENSKKMGYVPRDAVIDVPEEGALDLLLLLRDRLASEIGGQEIEPAILGVEVIHAAKEGNSGVKIRSISYVDPISEQIDRYAQIKQVYWCPWFRKQRLLNLLQSPPEEELPAWHDFDALLSRVPRKWLTDSLFSHDSRELFIQEGGIKKMQSKESKVRDHAKIVYEVCQQYVSKKLETKFNMKWDKTKNCPVQSERPISDHDFDEKKYKIANEAFLAVRSRTENQAFID